MGKWGTERTRRWQRSGGIVGSVPIGERPEVEGVAGLSALEAVEDILVVVGGEAAGGGGGGAVQGAGSAVLGALSGAGPPAEQIEDGDDREGGAHSGEVDGRSRDGSRVGFWSDRGLTLAFAFLGLSLALCLRTSPASASLRSRSSVMVLCRWP